MCDTYNEILEETDWSKNRNVDGYANEMKCKNQQNRAIFEQPKQLHVAKYGVGSVRLLCM